MGYLVLALKWRPQTFDEVAGQDAIGQTLKNAIRSGRTAHAYLFTGPRGVGKTSMARILAKSLNCAEGPTPDPCNRCDACREITGGRSLDVMEIDGASNRGIDDIRELRENVRYAPAGGRVKVYIVDEVHMLTTDAFNALLKTLEEPPSHVVFVLATTEPLKVPATIISRCQRYDFSRLRLRDTLGRLHTICESEKIEITEDALSLIARRAEGSMRDALTLLDQVVASGRAPLDGKEVTAALGIAGRELYFALSDAVLDGDPHRALSILGTAYTEGQNLQEVAEELVSHLRNLLVFSLGDDMAELVDATDAERDRYGEQARRSGPADLIRQLHLAMEAASRMRRSAFPRVILEVTVAEICLLPRAADLAQLVRKLPAMAEGIPARNPDPAPRSGPSAGGSSLGGPTAGPGAPAAAPVAASVAESPTAAEQAAPEQELWRGVIERLRKGRPALAAILAGSELIAEESGYLRVRLPGEGVAFQVAALESGENRPAVQKAIREVFGRSLGLKIDQAEAGAGSSGPMKAKEPAPAQPPRRRRGNLDDVQRIAEKMDGEILGPA